MSRIGSSSKVLTAMAILHLKEQGKLDLDARFLDVLPQYHVQPGGDSRLSMITIRQLMQHSGGWDRDISGDPIFKQREIAKALGIQTPVMCADVIRYEMSQPLDFAPGTRFAYSNFGYCILGQIVEKIGGQPIELYVREHVLVPMDVHAMSIGYSHLSERGPKEVKYYGFDGESLFQSVFPGEGAVPEVYGSFDMMSSPASGGWIGSAIDLTRVMTAIDGSRKASFLSPESKSEWLENPQLPAWSNDGTWYGLGVFVHAAPELWYHGGSIPGGETQMLHDGNGYVWAIVTNSRSRDIYTFPGEMDAAMIQALGNGVVGSSKDLYDLYPSPDLPARTK
jgi:N-acyl-D-amino-acid deacylase